MSSVSAPDFVTAPANVTVLRRPITLKSISTTKHIDLTSNAPTYSKGSDLHIAVLLFRNQCCISAGRCKDILVGVSSISEDVSLTFLTSVTKCWTSGTVLTSCHLFIAWGGHKETSLWCVGVVAVEVRVVCAVLLLQAESLA